MKKKRVAAISAVKAYMKTEEDCLLYSSMMPAQVQPEITSIQVAPTNAWGISGRQAQMQLRSLMQLKIFQKL